MKQVIDKLEALEEVVQQLVTIVTDIKKQEPIKPKITLPNYKSELQELNAKIDNVSTKGLSERLDLLSTKIEQIKPPKLEFKQFRFLLFPETNQGQYYKIVFGRLIPWGILTVLLAGRFSLGQSALENQRIKNYNVEARKYIDAWTYMESHSKDKKFRKEMSSAWNAANR